MIQQVSCHAVWAHQGGCCMSLPFSPDQEQSTLALVWVHLSSDLQTRVIGLLAQLALNVVLARSTNQSREEEVHHAERATDPQSPS